MANLAHFDSSKSREMSDMIKRDMAKRALELWKKCPVLTITGPRQS